MDGQVYRVGDEGDMVRVFTDNDSDSDEPEFMGVGLIDDEGRVAPKRLVVKPQLESET